MDNALKGIRILGIAVLVSNIPVSSVLAATATANLSVNATYSTTAACTISVPALQFGSYPSSAGGDVTAQTFISNATCTSGGQVTLSTGSGTYTQRTLTNVLNPGASPLNYNIYTDSIYTKVWGNGTDGSYVANFGVLNPTLTVYGKIPSSQAPAGATDGDSYQDTIVVSVTF